MINNTRYSTAWFLVFLLFFIGLMPVWLDFRKKRFDIFEIKNVFLVNYLMMFGIWTIYILITGKTKWPISLDEEYINISLILAILGLVFFYFGYYNRLIPSFLAQKMPALREKWNRPHLWIAIICLTLTGILAFLFLMKQVGGITSYFRSMEYFRAGGLTGKGYFVWFSTSLLSIALLLFYIYKRKLNSLFFLILFLIWLSPTLIIGYRSLLLFPVAQLMILRHYLKKHFTFKELTPIILLMVFLLSFFSLWRDFSSSGFKYFYSQVSQNWTESFSRALYQNLVRFHGVEVVAIVYGDLSKTLEFEWGLKSIEEVITLPLPRTLFPEKIESISFRFGRAFFEKYIWWGVPQGVSPTIIGEFYWNFGILGVTLGMLFFGIFAKFLYVYLKKSPRNPSVVLLYAIGATYIFFFVESPITATNAFLPSFLIASILLFLVTRKSFLPSSKNVEPESY